MGTFILFSQEFSFKCENAVKSLYSENFRTVQFVYYSEINTHKYIDIGGLKSVC